MPRSAPDQEPGQVSVLIADDHPVYRSGLRSLLEGFTSISVVGEAGTGAEVLTLVNRLRPHLVLMDVNMPGVTGIEATKLIIKRWPDTAVIVVTMAEDRDAFLSAIRAGARGYLLKGGRSEVISMAIEIVRAGGLAFDAMAATWAIEHLTKPAASDKPFPELTDREREVLELVADGRGNVAIARELDLSVKTVRNYLSRIFAKLRLVDRTEAAVLARRAGLGH